MFCLRRCLILIRLFVYERELPKAKTLLQWPCRFSLLRDRGWCINVLKELNLFALLCILIFSAHVFALMPAQEKLEKDFLGSCPYIDGSLLRIKSCIFLI